MLSQALSGIGFVVGKFEHKIKSGCSIFPGEQGKNSGKNRGKSKF